MSALFILTALSKYAAADASLTTLEVSEPQFTLSSSMLRQRFKDMVSCHFGNAGTALGDLAKSIGRIDFLFHDARHSRDDLIRDFGQVCEALVPGAFVLFDDIRWENPADAQRGANTYEGWEAVFAHPRVRRAVEINGDMGLLLMG
jgi:predicted O-methyltransferase YrrM